MHSFQTLLEDLATLAKNRVRLVDSDIAELYRLTEATRLQEHAFDLLGVTLTA